MSPIRQPPQRTTSTTTTTTTTLKLATKKTENRSSAASIEKAICTKYPRRAVTDEDGYGRRRRACFEKAAPLLLLLVALLSAGNGGFAEASEFPERECCDPIYPVTTTTTPHPPSAITVPPGKTGVNLRTSIAILNCLLARQLCFEDASCSAILEIIPRVCGSELVACSTVTVTKCQAALRTLQAFPFFKPTCLCREPNVDPECNSFRDFLFDHPCVFVLKKEKDPYPVEALPTCNYALNVCHSEKACTALFDNFKLACRARDGDCKMEDREQCRDAWSNLRMSPLFGCICPNNHMKKRCDRIFAVVNHNPCVANAVSPDGKKIMPNKTTSSSSSGDWFSGIDVAPDDGLEIDENHVSPHVMEEGHRRLYGKPGRRKGGTTSVKNNYGTSHINGHKKIGSGEGHGDGDGEVTKISLHSTCHLALDRCIRDKSCTTALTPVLQTCDVTRCDREGCMEALRNFYRTQNVQWNLEIAFCLCKKTDNKDDPCMNAQEKLHPVCAQREPGAPLPACHVLAQSCREQSECRNRLELYEQSCAVDSVTKKCAGSPEACRSAVLDMLGTELRTACACKGTDYTQLYDCLGWQRLLWLNPCVVESQSDFHIKTYSSGSTPATVDNAIKTVYVSSPEVTYHRHTTTIYRSHPTFPTSATIMIPMEKHTNKYSGMHVSPNMNSGRNIEVEIQGGKALIPVPTIRVIPEIITTEKFIEPETTTTTLATTVTEEETTTTSTTTSTTPEPIKYCIVQRPELDDQFVQKGHTRRLYRDTELDCSELCHCDGQLSVSCHAVCVQHAPCRTALAFYSHAAPAYQAYRGRCYCYSGNFICMRPNPGEYSLAPGVYLLLGFSSQDEALLRPHTRLGLEDAVRILQEYMVSLTDDGTNCTLTLFNVTNENMIISAGISATQRERNTNPLTLLDIDKIECIGLLEIIKSKINSQDYDISSHLLLSIFKIAEVDVVYPPPSGAPKGPEVATLMLWCAALLPTLLDCNLVLRTSKYIIHKSMLAIIVAHFLYSITMYLILSSSHILKDAFSMYATRSSYEKICFPLTLTLRNYSKIYRKHINSAVKITYSVFLSVKDNFKTVMACDVLTRDLVVNLAKLAFITRPKTDVFILFYKPDGSPVVLIRSVLWAYPKISLGYNYTPDILDHNRFLALAVHSSPLGEPTIRPPFHLFIR